MRSLVRGWIDLAHAAPGMQFPALVGFRRLFAWSGGRKPGRAPLRMSGLLVASILAILCSSGVNGDIVRAGALRSVRPGDLVTHVFTVRNPSTQRESYRVNVALPEGWMGLPVVEQLGARGGEGAASVCDRSRVAAGCGRIVSHRAHRHVDGEPCSAGDSTRRGGGAAGGWVHPPIGDRQEGLSRR